MIKLSYITDIFKGKRKASDVWSYFQGQYRLKIYYSESIRGWLMREHIHEQINCRIRWMDKECYDSGACKVCGCETIALQCANKSCDRKPIPCYPPMMNEKNWNGYIRMNLGVKFKDGSVWIYLNAQDKPILLLDSKDKDKDNDNYTNQTNPTNSTSI